MVLAMAQRSVGRQVAQVSGGDGADARVGITGGQSIGTVHAAVAARRR